jgi:peptidoglycan/xylan/chitin deacetylase (PgdA/CDA1 family)
MVRCGPVAGLVCFLVLGLATCTAHGPNLSSGRERAAPVVATANLARQGPRASPTIERQPPEVAPGELAAAGSLPEVAHTETAPALDAPTSPLPAVAPTLSVLPPDPTPAAPTPAVPAPPASDAIRLPILMYHHLRVLSPKAGAIWEMLTVTPAAFEEQVAYLTKHGYHTIYFSDLVASFDQGRALPPNPILLTFDDGWLDDYTVAYPILRKYGMVGAFFPPTNWVGKSKLTITWQQVEEMDRGGMEFGSHTVSHRLLTPLKRAQVLQELQLSQSILEGHVRRSVVALAYPGGAHNGQTMELAAVAGYGVAVGVTPSAWQQVAERYTLRRITVPYGMSLAEFAARVGGSEGRPGRFLVTSP